MPPKLKEGKSYRTMRKEQQRKAEHQRQACRKYHANRTEEQINKKRERDRLWRQKHRADKKKQAEEQSKLNNSEDKKRRRERQRELGRIRQARYMERVCFLMLFNAI